PDRDHRRCGDRSFRAARRRIAEADRRRVHQAGEDDHRAGDLPDDRHRHRRDARSGCGRPRRREGFRLFPHLLHAGAGGRHGGGQ
ncbi:hypothetical protein LTR94_036484, partial [Friedmanniomyces endolithicus]